MELSDRFEAAFIYAFRLHRMQLRKGTQIPYIAHLLSVAALVLEDGGTEDEAIAALLHDAIEDQGGAITRHEIHQRFGDQVSAIVEGCTESDRQPKPPWRERKLASLNALTSASASVQRVALADKLHNARSTLIEYRQCGDRVWQKFRAGREEILWFYQQFIDIQAKCNDSPFLDELKRLVAALRCE